MYFFESSKNSAVMETWFMVESVFVLWLARGKREKADEGCCLRVLIDLRLTPGLAFRYFLKINFTPSVHFYTLEFLTRYFRTLLHTLFNGESGDRPQTDSGPCLALLFNSFQYLT